MFRRLTLATAVVLTVALVAEEAAARNPAYYGTQRKTSARVYSGQYQAFRPNVVPTFSVPFYGGGNRSYYRGRGFHRGGFYGGGFYQRPVVIYPPAVYYGF